MGYHLLDSPKAMLQRYPNLRDLIQEHKHHIRTDKDCANLINKSLHELDDDEIHLAYAFIAYCILCGVNVVPYVEQEGFANLFDLTSFKALNYKAVITDEVVCIGCFADCTDLKWVELPNAVHLLFSAFENCESLHTVVGSYIEQIDMDAFSGCKRLKNIDLNNCTMIGNRAFLNCKSLTEIDLPNLKSIGNCAFEGCTNLKTIFLNADLYENKYVGTEEAFIEYLFGSKISRKSALQVEIHPTRNISYR